MSAAQCFPSPSLTASLDSRAGQAGPRPPLLAHLLPGLRLGHEVDEYRTIVPDHQQLALPREEREPVSAPQVAPQFLLSERCDAHWRRLDGCDQL